MVLGVAARPVDLELIFPAVRFAITLEHGLVENAYEHVAGVEARAFPVAGTRKPVALSAAEAHREHVRRGG
jgi:hypothetical protein